MNQGKADAGRRARNEPGAACQKTIGNTAPGRADHTRHRAASIGPPNRSMSNRRLLARQRTVHTVSLVRLAAQVTSYKQSNSMRVMHPAAAKGRGKGCGMAHTPLMGVRESSSQCLAKMPVPRGVPLLLMPVQVSSLACRLACSTGYSKMVSTSAPRVSTVTLRIQCMIREPTLSAKVASSSIKLARYSAYRE